MPLRTLNTDIMAGKGPDILILDGMPVENYIQKGLLEDITDTVEAVSREDGLFENIMRTFEKDDKIYAVPLGFLLPVVQGDEAVVNAAESMNTLAEQIAEIREANPHTGRIMIPTDSSDFLEIFYNLENAAMRNEDGTLNEEALKAFLENMKKPIWGTHHPGRTGKYHRVLQCSRRGRVKLGRTAPAVYGAALQQSKAGAGGSVPCHSLWRSWG